MNPKLALLGSLVLFFSASSYADNPPSPPSASITSPAENKSADAKKSVPKTTASKSSAVDDHKVHWSYVDGAGSPEKWGSLDKANVACSAGKTQSPININSDRILKVDLPSLEFLYKPSPLSIIDNGHTVMVKYGEGSNLIVDGRQYRLLQFHFHKPSEEAINGERTDMVVHLVHQHFDGSLAVVGVLMSTKPPSTGKKMFSSGDSPKENTLISTLWSNVPLIKNQMSDLALTIDANQLLPADRGYFTFMGSLTTPPCTENVLWIVMKNPIYVSTAQVKNFENLYPMNARPLQARGDRVIKESNTR